MVGTFPRPRLLCSIQLLFLTVVGGLLRISCGRQCFLSVSLSFDDDDRLTGDDAITIIIITVLIGCCDITMK